MTSINKKDEHILEAIDPRFSDIYSKKKSKGKSTAPNSEHQNFLVPQGRNHMNQNDKNFCDLLARELSRYVENSVEFVHRDDSSFASLPVEGGVRLFSDSEILKFPEVNEEKVKRKRRKQDHVLHTKAKKPLTKEEGKKRLEEAAVSYEWVLQQSEIYNSL